MISLQCCQALTQSRLFDSDTVLSPVYVTWDNRHVGTYCAVQHHPTLECFLDVGGGSGQGGVNDIP